MSARVPVCYVQRAHIHICLRKHICLCVCACMCTCVRSACVLRVRFCACAHVHKRMCVCVQNACVCMCLRVCVCVRVQNACVCMYALLCVCTCTAQQSACARVSVALVSLKPCTDRCSWLHAAMSWKLQKDMVRVLLHKTGILTDDPDGWTPLWMLQSYLHKSAHRILAAVASATRSDGEFDFI